MNNHYIIYKITNLTNQKSYIGLTTRDLSARWSEHVAQAFNPNSKDYEAPFKRAIRKYGVDNWKKEIIDSSATSLIELKEKEIYWIKYYNTYVGWDNCQGYNATKGGDGYQHDGVAVNSYDPCTGQLIKSYKSIAEAERDIGKRISTIGQYNHSSNQMCFLYHEDSVNFTQEELTNYIHSLYPYLVYQLDLNGKVIKIFWNTVEASRETDTTASNLIMCCNGQRRQANGYQWAYQKNIKEKINKPIADLPKSGVSVIQYKMNGAYVQAWENATMAANSLSLSDSHIIACCKRNRQSTGGFQWRYASDNLTEVDPIYTKRQVQCIETKEIFKTCNETAKHFKYSPTTVKKNLMGEKINKPYHFQWYDD